MENDTSRHCQHEHQETTWNEHYVEGREKAVWQKGFGWIEAGEVMCRDCGTRWIIYQAPGLLD